MMQEECDLFQLGVWTLASGKQSYFKIECDALTDGDLDTIANLIVYRMGRDWKVEGVPTGGERLARKLDAYQSPTPESRLLIVDDVLTTGGSMERQRAGRKATGVVIFARGEPPEWVHPIFRMWK